MPQPNDYAKAHAVTRMSTFLTTFLAKNSMSKTKLASIVGETESRVKDWMTNRNVQPATAFKIGDSLRREGYDVSGLELLWVRAAWPELVDLLIDIASGSGTSDPERMSGPSLARAIYCWLPQRMLDFEKQCIRSHLARMADVPIDTSQRAYANGRLPPGLKLSLSPSGPLFVHDQALENDIKRLMTFVDRDASAREIMRFERDNWSTRQDFDGERYQSIAALDAICLSGVVMNVVSETFEAKPTGGMSVSFGDLGLNGETINADRQFAYACHAAAMNLREMFPSYAAPKLWRLLGTWMSNLTDLDRSVGDDLDEMVSFSLALPDNFVSAAEVHLRKLNQRAHLHSMPDHPDHDSPWHEL